MIKTLLQGWVQVTGTCLQIHSSCEDPAQLPCRVLVQLGSRRVNPPPFLFSFCLAKLQAPITGCLPALGFDRVELAA